MNRFKWVLLLGGALAGFVLPQDAAAHRRWHGHVGVFVGPPWVDPWYYPQPYPYPPVVLVPAPQPAAPPVYIERGADAPAGQSQQDYWYYCADPQGYYPYIKECPKGWLQVVPTVPPQP